MIATYPNNFVHSKSPQDYEYLLVAANLAQFHPQWGFSIKILKWKFFVEGHQFLTINCMGTMEVSSKKLA